LLRVIYAQAAARHLLVRDAGTPAPYAPAVAYDNANLYDLFQPAARAYAWAQVQRGYVDQYGLRHFWLDCDEPCGAKDNGALLYNNGTWPASFVGAAYPHMLNRMVFEGSGGESVVLARSAWAGSQRYGTAVWSGDTSSNFANLNEQFRAGLNMVMSGMPYWTTDIGGYSGGNVTDPGFRELIVRWFQWGAFCPVFRLHGRRSGGPNQEGGDPQCGATNSANEIWHFGAEAEAAIGRVMALREQLRPYVAARYAEAAATGAPVMRPMFYDFWTQLPAAAAVDDQMMFGPDYLVAPQLREQASARAVWLPQLPPTAVWKNVFTGALTDTSAGARNITEPTPLSGEGFGTFPLYFRMPRPAPTPPPTPVSPPAPCGGSCTITPNLDADRHTLIAHSPSSSDAECCATCKANPACEAFVRGPNTPGGADFTCFQLTGVTSWKASNDRSFGCVRPPS
jgi:alpha-D-xyloside xylohydrolase